MIIFTNNIKKYKCISMQNIMLELMYFNTMIGLFMKKNCTLSTLLELILDNRIIDKKFVISVAI